MSKPYCDRESLRSKHKYCLTLSLIIWMSNTMNYSSLYGAFQCFCQLSLLSLTVTVLQ